jgi:hypothetical protein
MFRRFPLALDFVLRSHGGARRLRHTAAIAVFVAAFVGLNQSSVRAESSAIATVHLTPGWATFGEAVPRGVAFDALQVGSLQTQTDVKTRWDDHSIRFAVVTVNATADGDYAVVPAANPAGVPLTPSLPAASVSLTIGGVAHTATLPGAWSDDRWLSGPLAYEARSIVAPVSAADGAAHPFLRVIFDTRKYLDGNGRVDVTVENVLDDWDATTVTYDAAISVNGTVVYSHPAVEHYYLTRWRKTFAFGTAPWATVRPDTTPFNAARALPPYLSVVTNRVDGITMPQFDILHEGALTPDMSSHSGRAELAPFPDWTARYLVHKDPAQLQFVLANGDLSGSWPIHVRESDASTFGGVGGGHLVSLNQRPLLWYDFRGEGEFMQDGVVLPPGSRDDAGELFKPGTLADVTPLDFVKGFPMPMREYSESVPMPGQSPLTPDNAHQPSLAYVPYLLTGDRYYADEMAFWANYGMLRTYPADGVRSNVGVLDNNEVRGYGWSLRNIADAAAYSPEESLRSYFREKVTANLNWLDGIAHSTTNSLGVMWIGKRPEVGFISLWEQTYLAYAIDRANQQGFAGGLDHRNAIANLQLRLFTDPIWPREQPEGTAWAAPYLLGVGTPGICAFDTQTFECWENFTYFDSFEQVKAATVGQDWLQRDYAGFYGPEARLNLMMLIASGNRNAIEPYTYLYPFIGQVPGGCADSHLGSRVDLDCRPGWALGFYPGDPTETSAPTPDPTPNTAPTFVPPADIVVTATSASNVIGFAASGTDAEDGLIPAVCTPASGSVFAFGSTPVNCNVTDSGHLTASGSFMVTVNDATPAIGIPQDVTETATSAQGAAVLYAPVTAADYKDGPLTAACAPPPGSTFPIGATVVSCLVANSSGMTATAAFNVTVLDAPPAFTPPADITATATSAAGAAVKYDTPTATDFKDTTVTVSCSPDSDSTFSIGTTPVNCSATNSSGLLTNHSFVVTVDDAPPAFDVPSNITAQATSAAGAVVTYVLPAVADFADGPLTAVCTPASGTEFAVGTTTVNCTATNSAHMTASHSFTVTVTPFVAPPPPVPGATPAGTNVSVRPTSTSTIVFSNVTAAGITSVTPLAVAALPPIADGFAIFGQNLVFDVSTTATFTGTVSVCFTVPSVADAPTFATLRVLHRELDVMVDKTSGSDFATHTVCADVSSLSPFAIGMVVNRLSKFVAFSDEMTWLQANATVVNGDVGANGRNLRHPHDSDDDDDRGTVTVRVGERVTMQQAGSRVVGDVVRLDDRASVYSLVYNTLKANRATILGSKTTAMAIPFLAMPAMHEAVAGSVNVEVAKGATKTLAAGAYRKVHVATNATLVLTGGVYQMRSLDVDASATVIFRGATEIRIATELDTDNRARLILDPAASGLKASDVVVYVGGTDDNCGHDGRDAESGDGGSAAAVHVGENNVVQANIYAPRGTVRIKSQTQATGAFIGEHVRIGQNVTLRLDSAFK